MRGRPASSQRIDVIAEASAFADHGNPVALDGEVRKASVPTHLKDQRRRAC